MRLDSPAVLATAGTLAIHLLFAVAGDAIVVMNPPRAYEPAPVVELFDIVPEPPPIEKPPPPPVEEDRPEEPAPEPPPVEPVRAAKPAPQRVVRTRSEPVTETPPAPAPAAPSGGAPVAHMEGIAPSATGIPVARGRQGLTDRVGRGGTGTGTGAGAGSGSGSAEAAKPVSVATIKKRAMPKGDFSYFDASKDYPPEAKALGIEGVIRVRLVVDAHGKVTSRVLLNRLGHGLDELALRRAAAIAFDPALDTDDRPVSSVVVWTFTMTLPR